MPNNISIVEVRNLSDFTTLKPHWDKLYDLDSTTTCFVSWAFIKGWIDGCDASDDWCVLAAKSSNGKDEYAGFLPLGMDANSTICIGGNDLSDHTGFVIAPEYETDVLRAFAGHICEQMVWETFRITDVFDQRVSRFLDYFPPRSICIENLPPTPCPCVTLLPTWDAFLSEKLGKRTRYDVRLLFKKADKIDSFRKVYTSKENYSQQVNAIMMLWQKRWGALTATGLQRYTSIFNACFEADMFSLLVCWDGDVAVGAVAGFKDNNKKQFFAYLNCYNMEYKKLRSPGQAVQAYDLHHAIQEGYEIYDMTRGAEQYKYLFSAKDRYNANIIIYKRTMWRVIKLLLKKIRDKFTHST